MTVPIIQSDASEISVFTPEHTSHSLAWPNPPSPGNTLVAFLTRYDTTLGGTGLINNPAGWTQQADEQTATGAARTMRVATKTATASEGAVVFTFDPTRRSILTIVEVAGSVAGVDCPDVTGVAANATQALATASPTPGTDVLMLQAIVAGNAFGISSYPASWTSLHEIVADDGASERSNLFYRQVAVPSGTYGGAVVYTGSVFAVKAALWFISTLPVADFSGFPTSILQGESVGFTDLSSGAPTSWLWDFGDGATSTSQNPSHTYAIAGSYTVTLTATNASGSDSETKTSYIAVGLDVGYEPPVPAGALLEIYAAAPGSARWGIAKWGEDQWSQAGWQNVTPQGISVEILWGSDRPELGILSVPAAASWAVDYYDPDRLLDPANTDSPYYGDLIPGLPIRLSHRGTIVRVGHAESIGHTYAQDTHNGYMRCTDKIALMANAEVPSDTELADSLYSRAVDAIAAAGLNIHVRPPRPANPAVSPWITGTREWTVWEWIKDAAQEVHYIPFIDALGNLDFRPWDTPLVRGRSVDSDELIDLQVITDWAGLVSVVQAREDDTTIVERALTPPPRYGARVFRRDEITIDPGDWADTVLADRALPMLRWEPGAIRPLTAISTENLATIEAVERISIAVPEESPPVNITGIVVGGEIRVTGKFPDEAKWRFKFQLAQTTDQPLTEDGAGLADYLTTEDESEFLYPDT